MFLMYLMQQTIFLQVLLSFLTILGITSLYGASFYYAQETGTDQVNSTGTTSIDAYIRSGDYDITSKKSMMGTPTGVVDFRGDGEYFMSVSRVLFLILNI